MSTFLKKAASFPRFALLFLLVTAIIISCGPCEAAGTEPPVLLIDPGHGGLDGGAVAADGTTASSLNLAISLKLRDLCRLFGVPCAMTRDTESLPYPPTLSGIHEKKVWDQRQRAETINAAEHSVLISIHQNKYPDARPSGTQVLYASGEASAQLGSLTHELLRACLCPENRRVPSPAPDSIYLLKHISCPAILVECGFLSNPAELVRLKSSDYQTGIAAVLLAGYSQFLLSTNDNSSPDGGT